MDSKVARPLAQHVASNFQVVEALNAYADYRIEFLRTLLEREVNHTRICQLQGAIEEVRLMKKLREHSQDVIERDRNG